MLIVNPMKPADLDEVVEVMARAFQNAPLYRYFIEDEEKRPDFLRMVFRRRILFGFEDRDIDVAVQDGSIAGAAVWIKPLTPGAENRELNAAVEEYGAAVFEKWRHFHAYLFNMLDESCPEPHWSLAPIAVAPEAQGQGIARAMLLPKLARIDREGAACLLATQDLGNTRIYARYGFKTVQSGAAAAGTGGAADLMCYAMMRRFRQA